MVYIAFICHDRPTRDIDLVSFCDFRQFFSSLLTTSMQLSKDTHPHTDTFTELQFIW